MAWSRRFAVGVVGSLLGGGWIACGGDSAGIGPADAGPRADSALDVRDASGDPRDATRDAASLVSVCGEPVIIDSTRSLGAHVVQVASSSGDFLAIWAHDQQGAMPKRIFGSAFDATGSRGELDLGEYNHVLGTRSIDSHLVDDGKGQAFAVWQAPAGAMRSVYSFATRSFGALESFGDSATNGMALAPLSTGGALVAFRAQDGIATERWDATTTTWTDRAVLFAAGVADIELVTNPVSHHVGALSMGLSGPSGPFQRPVSVARHDGITWSAPQTAMLSLGPSLPSYPPNVFELALLPDDAAYVLYPDDKRRILAARVVLAGPDAGFVGSPEVVASTAGATMPSSVSAVADPSGAITVVWVEGGELAWAARRAPSGTWGAAVRLDKAGDGYRLAVGPSGDVVIATIPSDIGTVALHHFAPGATTWRSLATNLPTGGSLGSGTPRDRLQIVFAPPGIGLVRVGANVTYVPCAL